MSSLWDEIVAGFSDLPSLEFVIRLLLRLSIAAALGVALGFERKWAGKSAGLRTHMLVSLGSALFVLVPQQAGASSSDLSRIIQGVISGMGFLGAGAILKPFDKAEGKGLTTAAGLWLTCAIGVAVGLGRLCSAVLGTVLALVILTVVHRVSEWLEDGKEGGGVL